MSFLTSLGSLKRGRTLKKPTEEAGNSQPLQQQQPHRALQIPEVVEAILSYVLAAPIVSISDVIEVDTSVLPKDDRRAARRLLALQVCKLWYCTGRQLLAHNREWSNAKPTDTDWMGGLSRCRRLVCRFETTTYTDNSSNQKILDSHWETLLTRLKEIYQDNTPSYHHGPLPGRPNQRHNPCRGINELCIKGHFKFHTQVALMLSIPSLCQSITMLDLHFNNFDVIDPTLFFRGTIANTTALPIAPLPNLRHLYLHKIFVVDIVQEWELVEQPSTLCSLSLENVRVGRRHLAHLLKKICGPKLTHLRLKNIFVPDASPTLLHDSPMGGIPSRIVNHLVTKCSQLESIEVDRSTMVKMMDGAWSLSTAFPKIKVVRIANGNFHYNWTSMLPAAPEGTTETENNNRTLTHIDIQGPVSADKFTVQEFRQFMHHSVKCQHLLVLTALNIDVRVDLLVPHLPWQCRNLQVLHLGFSSEPNATSSTSIRATSRHIFGFITTTFPNLRHLVVRGPLCISEATGGFCYLSRLKFLETVTFRTSAISLWGGGASKLKKVGPPIITAAITTAIEEPRWMVQEPKVMDKMRKVSSLRQCRAMAELDLPDGYFGTVDGREILWPSNVEDTKKQKSRSYEAVQEGCCWERMQSIRFELSDSYPWHLSPIATSLETMRILRPDVNFQASHVIP